MNTTDIRIDYLLLVQITSLFLVVSIDDSVNCDIRIIVNFSKCLNKSVVM